jgi:hypothetical protein
MHFSRIMVHRICNPLLGEIKGHAMGANGSDELFIAREPKFAFVEACHAWNAVEMGDELAKADLEQISIGYTHRWNADGLFMPSQLLAPLADFGVSLHSLVW